MPEHDNTPPFSNRRARACTAGVRETRANNSLVAVIEASCAKRGQSRSQRVRRQDGFLVFENVEGHIVGNGESVRLHGEQPETGRFLVLTSQRTIHQSPNVVRYQMNAFVIAVGSYVQPLTAASALQVGEKIGPVTADLGATNVRCRSRRIT